MPRTSDWLFFLAIAAAAASGWATRRQRIGVKAAASAANVLGTGCFERRGQEIGCYERRMGRQAACIAEQVGSGKLVHETNRSPGIKLP